MKPKIKRDTFLIPRFPELTDDKLNTEEEIRDISEDEGRIIVFPVMID